MYHSVDKDQYSGTFLWAYPAKPVALLQVLKTEGVKKFQLTNRKVTAFTQASNFMASTIL